ncbi:MAG: hypothetical protein RL071_3645 [Pseudomonadota bacterium]
MSAGPLVALLGNPNTGKTSLFNALTGQLGRVGNYPGVTVDRREAPMSGGGARLLDVPGCYSLAARSAEEQIALSALLGLRGEERPALCVVVADATQLPRTLYLGVQLRELGLRCVVALNMADELTGPPPDTAAVGAVLGCPAVLVSARTGQGLDALRGAMRAALAGPPPAPLQLAWPAPVEAAVARITPQVPEAWAAEAPARAALARWALLSVDPNDELEGVPAPLRAAVDEARAAAGAEDLDQLLISARYAALDPLVIAAPAGRSWTERIDAVLLHPVWGFLVFIGVMATVFQALFSWADPMIGLLEAGIGALGGLVAAGLPPGLLTDLLVEGVIGGAGNVVVFLPQIILLFTFIGILEGSGYLARVALLMDRLMRAAGLHGRAFVPMLSGFACAIPAVMATRTMERKRDRLLTMMVVPLMTCSARLPVYTLIIGALFPTTDEAGWPVQSALMVGMYLFSVLISLIAAAVLGRTVLRGPTVPFLLELPPYRWPQPRGLARMVRLRAQTFVKDAGGVILVLSICMWALLRFPELPEGPAAPAAVPAAVEGSAAAAPPAEADPAARRAAALEHSAAGRLGKLIEPAIAPLGFDWRIGIGLIGSFAAREVFVSTMGLVYGIGEEVDEESDALRDRIRAERRPDGRPVYSPLAGMSLLVFFALACQCMSTLAVVKRETRGYRWPAFLFAYMTALAWICSFALYQGGQLLGLEG